MAARKRKTPPLSELVGRAVVIYWIDSGTFIDGSIDDPSTFGSELSTSTIGVLVRYDKKVTVLCTNTNPDTRERDYYILYTPCITDHEIPE